MTRDVPLQNNRCADADICGRESVMIDNAAVKKQYGKKGSNVRISFHDWEGFGMGIKV